MEIEQEIEADPEDGEGEADLVEEDMEEEEDEVIMEEVVVMAEVDIVAVIRMAEEAVDMEIDSMAIEAEADGITADRGVDRRQEAFLGHIRAADLLRDEMQAAMVIT